MPHDAKSNASRAKDSSGAVDLTAYRTDAESSVTYHYMLRNLSGHDLHNFMVGHTLSTDSCPELGQIPIGFDWENARCPISIIVPKPWVGCVGTQEECEGGFLDFDYPEGYRGIAAGDSLAFSVTVETADSTYERPSFWIVGNQNEFEGRARKIPAGTAMAR